MIKSLSTDQLPEAFSLAWEVFLEFQAPIFSQEGIDEFRRFLDVAKFSESMKAGNAVLWGDYDGTSNHLIGTLALFPLGHICLLFVNPKHHKKGIARALFETAKTFVATQAMRRITVHASLYAAKIYEHLGFKKLAGEQQVNGIRFIPMEYVIHETK